MTLTIGGELRGCCGTIEPRRALALDVWRNAQVSVFDDPRFPLLAAREWAQVDLEIAVLSPLERVEAPGEEHLLQTLVLGQDGLVDRLARPSRRPSCRRCGSICMSRAISWRD